MIKVYRYFFIAPTKAFASVQDNFFLSLDLEYCQVNNAISMINAALA